MGTIIEVCVESVAGTLAAAAAGAQRIELCQALSLGGLTPSPGLLARVREGYAGPIVAMVRPRAGDFLYAVEELEVMQRDVVAAREAGAAGVALGCLRADGTVDSDQTAALMALARPTEVTFHRAFDLTRDPFEALETLIALGITRVLTSGQAPTAAAGAELIGRLVHAARGRIAIMAGAGIGPANVRRLVEVSGVREVHLSARITASSPMLHRPDACRLSVAALPGEYERTVTDPDTIRAVAAALVGPAGAGTQNP